MKTDEIKWRILNDTAENVVDWIAEKDRRIEALEAALRECDEAVKYTGSYDSVRHIVREALGDQE